VGVKLGLSLSLSHTMGRTYIEGEYRILKRIFGPKKE
jgi:hypothetical protein